MASSDATQRAVLAGLSCGIGLAAPVVMYAATLPFSSVNETVVAGAVPFAVGAVAGVGIYAASLGISEYRAQREERLFQPDAMGGAANLNQHQSEFKTASIPAQQQDATPYAAASASQAQSEQSTSAFLSGLTGAFQRRHADDVVEEHPVTIRRIGAGITQYARIGLRDSGDRQPRLEQRAAVGVETHVLITELDDEAVGFDIVQTTRHTRLNAVMSNSFGFGGTNATLILKNWTGA